MITRLNPQSGQKGTAWLQSLVAFVVDKGQPLLDA
jgi:hypothetical protein